MNKINNNPKYKKKALSSIIITTLLILITVIGGISTYFWYIGFTQNLENKKMQTLNLNIKEKIKIEALKNESSAYNLYIKSSSNGYIIINEIKNNNIPCELPKSNVIERLSITKIEINCDSYEIINEITIITSFGVINTKKRIS